MRNWMIELLRNTAEPAGGATGTTPPPAADPPADGQAPDGATPPSDPPAGSLLGDGDPKGETPPNDPPEVEPVAWESLTLPEGTEVAPEVTESFLSIINDPALSRAELAQKIVDLQLDLNTKGTAAAESAAQALWDQTQETWRTEAKALPEIGGAKLPETLATIKKGLDAAGADKAVYDALDLTGAGNHPAVIKVLHALTKNLAEGKPVSGSPTSGSLTQAERLYGSSAT